EVLLMLARVMWVIGLSAVTFGTLQACGDDGSSAKHGGPDGSVGGSNGAGGKSSNGGKAGASGSSGAGGSAALGCDTSSCDQQLAPLQGIIGTFIQLKSCCVSATKCGLDTSGIGALLGGAGVMLPPCIDPSMLTGTPTTPPFTITDAGVIT